MKLIKVGGICAIIIVAAMLLGGTLSFFAGVGALVEFDSGAVKQSLVAASSSLTLSTIALSLAVLGTLLLIVVGLGLRRALHQAKVTPWFAFTAFLVGCLLMTIGWFYQLVTVVDFVPSYLEAGTTARVVLIDEAATAIEGAFGIIIFGDLLYTVIGITLYSIVILRTTVLPHNLGWLGLVLALIVLLNSIVPQIFESVSPLFNLFFNLLSLAWIVGIAVCLIRLKEDIKPSLE